MLYPTELSGHVHFLLYFQGFFDLRDNSTKFGLPFFRFGCFPVFLFGEETPTRHFGGRVNLPFTRLCLNSNSTVKFDSEFGGRGGTRLGGGRSILLSYRGRYARAGITGACFIVLGNAGSVKCEGRGGVRLQIPQLLPQQLRYGAARAPRRAGARGR